MNSCQKKVLRQLWVGRRLEKLRTDKKIKEIKKKKWLVGLKEVWTAKKPVRKRYKGKSPKKRMEKG